MPRGGKEIAGQHLQRPPQLETPIDFIPMEPSTSKGQKLDVDAGTVPSDDAGLRANDAFQGPASSLGRLFQAVFVPQGGEGHEEDREQRIAADPGMDVDVVMDVDEGLVLESMEYSAGSPPLADNDRRVGPAATEQHQQGGPTESKLQEFWQIRARMMRPRAISRSCLR